MAKLLILLSLICFIYCKEECFSYETFNFPSKPKDCFSRITEEGTACCYLEMKIESSTMKVCYPIPLFNGTIYDLDLDEINKYMEEEGIEFKNLKCKGSYLKSIFLLLTLLLI